MNEQNIQSGRKKRLFGELTEEEVRELKQSQQDVSCPTANREYAKKKMLFEPIDPVSDSQKQEDAEPSLHRDNVFEGNEKTVSFGDIARNLEATLSGDVSLPVVQYPPSVSGQDYPVNPALSYMPRASLIPAYFPIRNEGRRQRNRQGIDIDHAEFVYSGGKLFAVDGDLSQELGNFALEILERKERIEEVVNEANDVIGTECQIVWGIKIVLPDRERQGYVEDSKLFGFSWIDRISERRAVLSNNTNAKKFMKKYLQGIILVEKYRKTKEFASCGWKWFEDGTVCYLTSDGAVGFDGNSIKTDAKFKLYTKPAGKRQNLQDFLKMREIIPGNTKNAVFLQDYLMASLLTAIFKKSGHQLEFCTALIGKTNTKKTSCGEIFTRIFNRTKSAVPEINFSATEAAIYDVMAHCADSIVMIDDLTPSENDMDAREKSRKLEISIRSYGDRVPRKRSVAFASNSSAKEFTPITGCALITGETFSGGKSSRSRVVVLNFEEGDVDDRVLGYFQENLHTLPNFVEDFLCYVTSRVEQVMETIDRECKSARESLGNYIRLPRYIDTYGALSAVASIFGGYILESGLMNPDEVDRLLESDRQLLLQIIMENDAQVSQISPGITILEALKHTMETNAICVKELCGFGEGKPENCVVYDENFYYITSEKLWECAKGYTDYRKIHFPYKKGRGLIEPLKAEGLLYIKKEGSTNRASHKITVKGKVVNKRFL